MATFSLRHLRNHNDKVSVSAMGPEFLSNLGAPFYAQNREIRLLSFFSISPSFEIAANL
jgi:hypothetical protein